MYDVIVRSTLFGLRNADKVMTTNDKGRLLADVGQFTKAAQTAAQLDNVLGKGASAALDAMNCAANGHKALAKAGQVATWASNHVNPLLIGAAGYRVAVADDKPQALKREALGMTSMFIGEALMSTAFNSKYMTSVKSMMTNKYAKAALLILQGVAFVAGSIASSTLGYKLGDKLFPQRKQKEENKKILDKALKDFKSTQKAMKEQTPNQTLDSKKVSA